MFYIGFNSIRYEFSFIELGSCEILEDNSIRKIEHLPVNLFPNDMFSVDSFITVIDKDTGNPIESCDFMVYPEDKTCSVFIRPYKIDVDAPECNGIVLFKNHEERDVFLNKCFDKAKEDGIKYLKTVIILYDHIEEPVVYIHGGKKI